MGSLWSHIHIDEHFVTSQYSSDMGQRIALWLRRSNGASLSLRFVSGGFERSNLQPIISLLQPHMPEVTSLIFYKASDQLVHAVFTLYGACSPSTPLVTLVVVDMHRILAARRLTWPIDNIRGLRMLVLCGPPNLHAPNFDELAQILLNNPDLHTLRIRHYISALSRGNSHPRAIVRNLKVLEFEYDGPPSLVPEKLLSILEPGINELDFVCKLPDNPNPMFFQATQEFLERANVTGLELKNLHPQYMGQEVSRYLDRTPHLQVLRLDFAARNNDSSSLDVLTATNDDGETRARCPNLWTLMISNVTMSLEAQAKLKRIVEVHHLSKLVLAYGSIIRSGGAMSNSEEFLDWLHQRIPTFIHLDPDVGF
ncbi:hypothetical protein FRC12_000726 [Ceratobasidium sp. 428]|nr:hypothetical protein FRC12_000726 [Ceratobasidium sp. 428]